MNLRGWIAKALPRLLPSRPAVPGTRGQSRPAQPFSRPTWYWFIDGTGHSQAIIPIERELGIYDDIRRLFPIVDVGITKIIRLTGGVRIEASDRVTRDLTDWMRDVRVNQTQRGLETWLGTHLDQMLMYGKSVGEIVPDRRGRDVAALTNLEMKTILLRAGEDPLSLRIIQRQQGPYLWVELPAEWILHSMHRPRGDNPHGSSLLRSSVWTCDILSAINNAMALTWEREGSPSFHVNWEPEPGFVDPDGKTSQHVVDNLSAQWLSMMAARKTGDVQDFFTSGKVSVATIGADHFPNFSPDGYRVFAEQLVGQVGLPAWLLGMHWSTTERLSAVQAEMISADIDALRREVQPQLEYLFDLRQRLAGRPGRFKVAWKPVTLTDLTETARGLALQQQGQAVRIENARRMWALGFWSQQRAAEECDDDLEERGVATVYAVPPDLPPQAFPEPGIPNSGPSS